MSPLQYLEANRLRDKQTVDGSVTRVRLVNLGVLHHLLNSPAEYRDSSLWRKDRVRLSIGGTGGQLAGESIWYELSQTRTIRQDEVEPNEEEGPPGLTVVEPLGRLNIGEVLVVCPDHEGFSGPSSQCLLSSRASLTTNSFQLLKSLLHSIRDKRREKKAHG